MKTAKLNKKKNLENKPLRITEISGFFPSAKRILIFPTVKQKKIINDWIASTRKVWNVCLHSIKTNNSKISEVELRDKYVIAKNMDEVTLKQLNWTLRTHKRIREYAVKDLISSYKSGLTRVKKNQIRKFYINPKNKRDENQCISLPHESSRINHGLLRVCGLDLRLNEKLEDQDILHNMRLVRKGESYYVFVPSFTAISQKDISDRKDMVGIDPGINAFHTYYSPEGEYGVIGADLKYV